MGSPTTSMHVEDGVAVITLQHPPMNSLHPQLLASMFDNLQRAHSDENVKAIVVYGKKNFSAGFDIPSFVAIQKSGEALDDMNPPFNALVESGKKPTVAAIEGAAMGGGCEVAMACNGRVCTPDAQLGLPELTLGIIPGFGGTQRLPRLVGIQKGLQMILTSKPLKAEAALKSGLVDAIVSKGELLQAAKKMALGMAGGQVQRRKTLQLTDKLGADTTSRDMQAKMAFEMARAQVRKSSPNLVHPILCVDAVEVGILKGPMAGLAKEREVFLTCVHAEAGRALVHIFLSRGATKKVRGLPERPLKCVAVLGGGLMGSGIATACILAGIHVLLKEINEKFMTDGLNRVKANIMSMVKKGRMTQQQGEAVLGRVKGCVDFNDFGKADMVIEAVIESIPLKQQIFEQLEQVCSPHCVLSTNTSTIDINVCAAKMKQPNRIVGAHFFSPAHVMPLLEIIRTAQTPPQIVHDCLTLAKQIKKTPVVVGNCTGFAVNRVFGPYTQAAMMLLDAGMDPYAIDKVINRNFGMPMGPFRLCDLVGGDVSLKTGSMLAGAFPERSYRTAIILALNEAGRKGEATKKGFYQYDDKRKASPDPTLAGFLQQSRAAAKLPPIMLSDEAIIEFCFFPVVNEGCRVCDEAIVDKVADLDIATVLSMGFPAYRGGLMHWGDTYGAQYLVKRLNQFAQMVPQHAGFFKPCDYLLRCARAGTSLASPPPASKAKL